MAASGLPPGLNTQPGRADYAYYADTSFVAGDSPVVLDIYTDLNKRLGTEGWVTVDGGGDITVEISSDGTNYGDAITVKGQTNAISGVGEVLPLKGFAANKIRITRVSADSAYRLLSY